MIFIHWFWKIQICKSLVLFAFAVFDHYYNTPGSVCICSCYTHMHRCKNSDYLIKQRYGHDQVSTYSDTHYYYYYIISLFLLSTVRTLYRFIFNLNKYVVGKLLIISLRF